MIVQGAIVPHAPLLTCQVHGPEAPQTERVVDAIKSMDFNTAGALAVLSPHGKCTGIYALGQGSMRKFGLDQASFEVLIDRDLSEAVASAWGAPLLTGDLDHGIVVPLSLMKAGVPVVAATVAEDAELSTALELGRSFARTLEAAARSVAFVASANMSAALSGRAPLGLRENAQGVEDRALAHLVDGVGNVDSILEGLAVDGGSCGAAPLAAFAEFFAGATTVRAYEAPFGVGYLVGASGSRS